MSSKIVRGFHSPTDQYFFLLCSSLESIIGLQSLEDVPRLEGIFSDGRPKTVDVHDLKNLIEVMAEEVPGPVKKGLEEQQGRMKKICSSR